MWGGEKKMKKEENQIKAYMGEGAVFNGSLSFEGTVRIDGKFEGEVNTDDTLIIGETGHLRAEIFAGTVICLGRVEGTIIASKKGEDLALVSDAGTPGISDPHENYRLSKFNVYSGRSNL